MSISGHLEKRAKGGWNIILELERDPSTKRRKRKKVPFNGTKPAANTEMARLITLYENGGHIEPANMTLAEYLEYWLEKYAKKKLADKTYAYKQQILDQKKKKLLLGKEYQDHDLIFSQDNGKPLHPDTISSWFPKFLERHGLPRIRFHELRHTHISHIIEGGASLAAASERARHAEKSTTANTYTHALNSAKKAVANIMSERLAAAKKSKASSE